ncbi:SusC/RagA family TonB-linked outer membrane protein [Chitinophaga sp. 212800010-3]|uniref:SusC/RagA family TonB-linked outer membrane protein n=1 Tax=unclassified Chitinophaga TaxID=2619133 RepID=UPI002DE63328|nr:hypothetical protein [Chitinophaga sp. 212800010-3]
MKHIIKRAGYNVVLCVLCGVTTLPAQAQKVDSNEQIDLGYFSQSRLSLTGAVSAVSGRELEKSPVAGLSQKLTGRLPGLIMMQQGGELSHETFGTYIRGVSTINGQQPLCILDGVTCSLESIQYITPEEIESVAVLRDASLTAIYGIQGANGAIVINTKRGHAGKLKVTFSYDHSFQEMTRKPHFIDAGQYAALRNQAWQNDGAAGAPPYSQKDLEGFTNGSNRELYPNNNFYSKMFRPSTMMERAAINVAAGNEKIHMFSNVNFMHQGGQFITDQTTFKTGQVVYDSKAGNNYWFNYRTNLDFQINRILSGFIRLNGNVTKESTGSQPNSVIYSSLFYQPPTMYGPYTPITTDPADTKKKLGGEVLTNAYVNDPAYGLLNRSGYGRYTGTRVMAQTGLDLDMGFLTDSLTLSGRFAYQTNSSGNQMTTQDYERWVRSNDPATLSFNQVGAGTWTNTPLAYSKYTLFSYQLSTGAQLNYKRSFGAHQVSGMGYVYYENQVKDRADGYYVFPYNRLSMGLTALWGYRNKYFLKGDLGYAGSEQFARDRRFTATPAVSAAWVLSGERWLSGVSWLTELKLRAAVGMAANDQLGGRRFMYVDYLVNGGNRYINNLNYMITEYYKGNPLVAPEKILQQNYGIDLVLWKDLSLSFDYFINRNNNMLIQGAGVIPAFTGLTPAIYPPVNEGKMRNAGFDMSVGYMKQLNKKLSVYANANFLYAANKILNANETVMGAGYAYQKRMEGYSFGQQFGYLVDRSNGSGYFTSREELNRVHYGFGTPRLGDFIYKNLNGDKTADGKDIIDEKDIAPVGNPLIPKVSYGISVGVVYKQFELSCLVQGTGLSSRQYQSAIGVNESRYGGIYSDIHQNAWTPERAANGAGISFPALSQQESVSLQPNDFFTMNTSYVRIKNLELAWSFPPAVLRCIKAEQARLVFNAQNLFTWDCLRTRSIDPEIASLDQFQIYRVFNIGVKLTF